jgi:hypothetical protein
MSGHRWKYDQAGKYQSAHETLKKSRELLVIAVRNPRTLFVGEDVKANQSQSNHEYLYFNGKNRQ